MIELKTQKLKCFHFNYISLKASVNGSLSPKSNFMYHNYLWQPSCRFHKLCNWICF